MQTGFASECLCCSWWHTSRMLLISQGCMLATLDWQGVILLCDMGSGALHTCMLPNQSCMSWHLLLNSIYCSVFVPAVCGHSTDRGNPPCQRHRITNGKSQLLTVASCAHKCSQQAMTVPDEQNLGENLLQTQTKWFHPFLPEKPKFSDHRISTTFHYNKLVATRTYV
jgi:hypothetical protein